MAITEHLHAVHPVCVAPTCSRPAAACDLDHDRPWPHGPTAITNLTPKSRRCHNRKTRRIWHTHQRSDGAVEWTTATGARWTYTPEPLPGWAPGEAYAD